MNTQSTISSVSGQEIPRTLELNIQPLIHEGQVVINGNGKTVMDDRWIYVNTSAGRRVINLWRARYCEKMYLSATTIRESIGENKLMNQDLSEFVKKVSNKLVFQKFGKWYRIYLRKITARTFGIAKVVPYNFTINSNDKYNGIFNHNLCIDWRGEFYVR